MTKNSSFDKHMHHMRESLLEVATLETGVLKNLKEGLDQLLDNVYKQKKELQKVAAMDAMIIETPISQPDEALADVFNKTLDQLDLKNQEIVRLQALLAGMGIETPFAAGQSVEMLRQKLEELNKRNRILREIYRKLSKQVAKLIMREGHVIIQNQSALMKIVPKEMILKEIKNELKELDGQIQGLYKENYNFKQQMKPQNESEKNLVEQKNEDSAPRRGPGKLF